MALFGAPIAHEDHAQRACCAALHLRDALRRYADELRIARGVNFSVRMGTNSGEVVVGKIGDDLRMDYTALGHTANLAARMEQIAEPGRICLAEATAQICQGFFALRDLGRHEVRGLSQPVGVFELEGVGRMRTGLEVSHARGFSKFVGRSSEMVALEAALERAIAGKAQVVGVVAEAGTGKSRLWCEFAERCRARETPVYEAARAGRAPRSRSSSSSVATSALRSVAAIIQIVPRVSQIFAIPSQSVAIPPGRLDLVDLVTIAVDTSLER